jgi:hypothetical protein
MSCAKELVNGSLAALPGTIIIDLHDSAFRNAIPEIVEARFRTVVPVTIKM